MVNAPQISQEEEEPSKQIFSSDNILLDDQKQNTTLSHSQFANSNGLANLKKQSHNKSYNGFQSLRSQGALRHFGVSAPQPVVTTPF